MKEKILITGAGGFIGHHLARYLKKKDYWVRGVDIVKPLYTDLTDFNEFMLLDLRDAKNVLKATSGMNKVYALAAQSGSVEYTSNVKAELVRDNSLININTANACVKENVKRLLFSSSACVYPLLKQSKIDSPPLKETDAYPAEPDTEYGWEKLFSERMYKSFEDDLGLEVRIARFFNVYGPECLIDTYKTNAPMALTKKVIEAGNNGSVRVWGDGNQTRSFCYVGDCVSAMHKLMNSNINEPVNIGTNNFISINKLVDKISKIEGVKVKKIYQLDKAQGVRGRRCNITKARKLLKWKGKVNINKGLKMVNKFAHQQLDKSH